MAKKKKTREQKILAEKHRRSQSSTKLEYSFIPKKINDSEKRKTIVDKPVPKVELQASTANFKEYLIHDLRKTTLVTASIIVIQLVIFFIIN